MVEMPAFSLKGLYYRAAFFFDDKSFTFKAELDAVEREEPLSIYDLRAAGAELIEMAGRADRLIAAMKEG